jgi:hypothetical protein
MKFAFCVACLSTDDLQHHHLVTRSERGSDDERNLITLCFGCHAKLHERRMSGVYNASQRMRDARRRLTSQGVYNGGKRPFGVDTVQDGEIRRMAPNSAEMAVIARMQAMRKDGATYRAIGAVTGHGPRSVMRILERMESRSS